MRDWKDFWNSIDTHQGSDNDWPSMMAQVGKTLQRQPIGDKQFKKTYAKIIDLLDLKKTDGVLDLCCGNGVVTTEIAPYVNIVFGVDFSKPLVDVANARKPENVTYLCASVLDQSLARLVGGQKFMKVYMNESLQHFAEDEFTQILDTFLSISEDQALFCLTGIPEKKNIFSFYDTEARRNEYYASVANGTEAIGTWWERQFLESVAEGKGLTVKTFDQSSDFYTHHYRFDAVVGRNISLD